MACPGRLSICKALLLVGLLAAPLLFSPVAHALVPLGGDLYFQSLQPFGWSTGRLSFTDAENIWTTTNNGYRSLLLHSPDAGITWQPVEAGLPSDAQVEGFTFLDAQHARALATWNWDRKSDTGQIGVLASDDGGTTWSLHSIASDGVRPWGESFVSTEVAFVVGLEYNAATKSYRNVLLSTADGGASWKRSPQPAEYPYDLKAVDARRLWLFDSADEEIFTSSTAGAGWTRHTLPLAQPFNIYSMQALTPKVAWLHAVRRAMPHDIFLRTTDGGRTWQIRAHLERYASAGYTALSANALWINASVDWAAPQQPAYFRHTTDGGLTWTRTYVNPDTAGAISVSPDGTLFAWGSGLSRSTDGGLTWDRLAGNRLGYWLNDVTAQPAGDLWSVGWTTPRSPGIYGDYDGDQGLLFRSSDGVSWQRQDIPDGPLLGGIDFADAQVGWAVGWSGRVLRTTDGGTTWSPKPASTSLGSHAVQAVDENTAVAIAWRNDGTGSSTILRTADGGATWTETARPENENLTAIGEIAPGHLLIGGVHYGTTKQMLLLECTDAGATWTERLLPYARTVRDITFVDALHGWILASDARSPSPLAQSYGPLVLRTTDGGTTWQTTSLGTSNDTQFWAIGFADELNGWLVGDIEMKTTDGGATWTDTGAVMPRSITPGWSEPVVRAATVRGQDLWAVGADELILSTVDTTADTAPPVSNDDGDRRWHNSGVTTNIRSYDIGSGIADNEYRLDSRPWQPLPGGSLTIDAAADHSADGVHTIEYRATDVAGNVEFPQRCEVRIDTRQPQTKAGGSVTVTRGKTAKLKYFVADEEPNGGTASVRITITRQARVVKALKLGIQAVNKWLAASFRCRLPAGRYTYLITARDVAGNQQSVIGHGRLVVR